MALHNAITILSEKPSWSAVTALFGPDSTLHSWAMHALIDEQQGGDRMEFEGESVVWRDLQDELHAQSLFASSDQRWVVVRQADKFVEKHRELLEKYVEKPSDAAHLVLDLTSFPANTRLYKAVVAKHQAVYCGVPQTGGKSSRPDLGVLRTFLTDYVAPRHQCSMAKGAADALIELIGHDVGFLDTTIAKLALYDAPGGKVSETQVREIIGGWRSKTAWEIVEAVASGNAGDALKHLDRMLGNGENPIGLLAQFSFTLRRLAMAEAALDYANQTGRRLAVSAALEQAGYRAWELQKGETYLRQIGRGRLRQLMRWLLEADAKLKLSHSSDHRARWVLEELFLKLGKTA